MKTNKLKMMRGIQIVGVIFGLAMSYLTFLYYKRGDYLRVDFVFWMFVWVVFLALLLFPDLARHFLDPFGIMSVMNLIMVLAFMVSFGVLFYQHDGMRKNEKRLRALVREMAVKGQRRNKREK